MAKKKQKNPDTLTIPVEIQTHPELTHGAKLALAVLRKDGALSRRELADRCGGSIPGARLHVQQLERLGLVKTAVREVECTVTTRRTETFATAT